jgi:hypothetical protein
LLLVNDKNDKDYEEVWRESYESDLAYAKDFMLNEY